MAMSQQSAVGVLTAHTVAASMDLDAERDISGSMVVSAARKLTYCLLARTRTRADGVMGFALSFGLTTADWTWDRRKR
jgi:hypothetical protein